MYFMIPLIFVSVSAILLSLNLMVVVPSTADYNKLASQKAYSDFYKTGIIPASVNVIGADITIAPNSVNTDGLLFQYTDNLAWKKANAEQAMVAICNQINTKCNASDIAKLFAYMPAGSGTVQSLLTGTVQATINCANPTDYGPYGRYLLQQTLTPADAMHTINNISYVFYYNKPTAGSGCYHADIALAKAL